jgi:hypothetical protein
MEEVEVEEVLEGLPWSLRRPAAGGTAKCREEIGETCKLQD